VGTSLCSTVVLVSSCANEVLSDEVSQASPVLWSIVLVCDMTVDCTSVSAL